MTQQQQQPQRFSTFPLPLHTILLVTHEEHRKFSQSVRRYDSPYHLDRLTDALASTASLKGAESFESYHALTAFAEARLRAIKWHEDELARGSRFLLIDSPMLLAALHLPDFLSTLDNCLRANRLTGISPPTIARFAYERFLARREVSSFKCAEVSEVNPSNLALSKIYTPCLAGHGHQHTIQQLNSGKFLPCSHDALDRLRSWYNDSNKEALHERGIYTFEQYIEKLPHAKQEYERTIIRLEEAAAKHPLVGTHFGDWTILRYHGRDSNSNVLWQVRCQCGEERELRYDSLTSGRSTSCGNCESSTKRTLPKSDLQLAFEKLMRSRGL